MKILVRGRFTVLLTALCAISFAQNSSHPTFAAYPQTVSLAGTLISSTLNSSVGSQVSISFSPEFVFTGTVIANQQKYDNLRTVIIRSSQNNSAFQLSRITHKDNSISYAGRIIGENSSDGYEIKNANGVYSLNKFQTSKILEPCNY